jgi:uncharacterized membrane protein YphA (DoxX/SURF4 family)
MTLRTTMARLDRRITEFMARHAIAALRVSLGLVFFWFGVLKFFPGLSPAQDLATRTIDMLTRSAIEPQTALFVLAAWECLIGLGLLFGVALRAVILLLLLQMIGTLMPLVFFPAETFYRIPVAPTLEGQYIIKNVVLVSAALAIGATVRGGALVADPEIAREAEEIEGTAA